MLYWRSAAHWGLGRTRRVDKMRGTGQTAAGPVRGLAGDAAPLRERSLGRGSR